MQDALKNAFNGNDPITLWLVLFTAGIFALAIWRGFFKARKIQPKGFKWKTFRNEIIFGVINVAISGTVIGFTTTWLRTHGYISVNPAPAAWWVIVAEYALYFVLFDAWFYWLHRWMHNEPFYSRIHKLHHFSTAPNVMTNFSVNPLESFINGGFVPLFLLIVPVHEASFALVVPTNVLMGLYLHSGYEFLPRWWNKSWATKWFITATFHDQHHKYFTANFGGYTTIWDRLCGTMRPKYEADFEKITARRYQKAEAPGGEQATV